MTVTLEDVGIQLGLPVDGLPVTDRTDYDWPAVCLRLLGVAPDRQFIKAGKLATTWITQTFRHLLPNADAQTVQQHARAYILELMGGSVFADKSSQYVHLFFLPLLSDLDTARHYSWGSATLAWLYRNLCRGTNPSTKQIGGCLILLQVWAWDRIPSIAPRRLVGPLLEGRPFITRWLDHFCTIEAATHVVRQYRYSFDIMTEAEVVWSPYIDELKEGLPEYCLDGEAVWRTIAPLICFYIIEMHHPDRVARQFGFLQPIPDRCDTQLKLHKLNLRSTSVKDWAWHHRQWVAWWNERGQHIFEGTPSGSVMLYGDPYMVWYRRITRLYVSRFGATIGYVAEKLARVCEISFESK